MLPLVTFLSVTVLTKQEVCNLAKRAEKQPRVPRFLRTKQSFLKHISMFRKYDYFLFTFPSLFLSTHNPTCLCIHPSIHLLTQLPNHSSILIIHLSIYPHAYSASHSFIHPFTQLPIYPPSVHPSSHPSTYIPIHPSVHSHIHQFHTHLKGHLLVDYFPMT